MSRYFITSSGTGVGKTLVTATLAYQLREAGKEVQALKPVISGWRSSGEDSDTSELLRAVGLGKSSIDSISPWRFKAPLAPSVAASMEGKSIALKELVGFCARGRGGVTLIEGVGGVMAPLTPSQTMLDWMTALNDSVILVVGTYLGAISHALTAYEALRARGLFLQAVVVSESDDGAMSAQETALAMKPFMPDARYLVALPRVAGRKELWKDVADLTWILE